MALERVLLPVDVTAGTWRLRRAASEAVVPTYADAAGTGASTAAQPAAAVRYAEPGPYVLEVDGIPARILYVNAPAALERRLAMTADAVVGFYGAAPVARAAGLTAASAAAVGATLYDANTSAVITNTRTRLNELEARLKAYGLLP